MRRTPKAELVSETSTEMQACRREIDQQQVENNDRSKVIKGETNAASKPLIMTAITIGTVFAALLVIIDMDTEAFTVLVARLGVALPPADNPLLDFGNRFIWLMVSIASAVFALMVAFKWVRGTLKRSDF